MPHTTTAVARPGPVRTWVRRCGMQTGTAPSDYARQHLISLNTVYTHLRRIKDEDRLQAHARTDPQA